MTLLLAPLLFVLLRGDETSSVDEALAKIEKSYGIEIFTDAKLLPVQTAYGPIEGKTADEKALSAYGELFAQEFALYPPELVKRARVVGVVFCEELAFNGQRRNAVPDFENNRLFLDVSRGGDDKTYLRKVIHHEFFHIIDLFDDGELYGDDAWKALNPPEFQYGTGGKEAQGIPMTSILTGKYPGFLNHYSTTGVEEDKAEIFANLIVEPKHVEKKSQGDPVLKAKVDRLKKLLVQFCPDADDRFWSKASAASMEQ